MSQKRVFLIGYFSSGNVGDDRLLGQSKQIVWTRYPGAEIRYLAARTAGQGVGRWSILKLMFTIFRSEHVVFSGGSLFQNQTSHRSFYYYCTLLCMAIFSGATVTFLGQGIGPIQGWLANTVLNMLLPFVHLLHLRDVDSYERVLGHVEMPVLGRDLVFYRASLQQKLGCRLGINLRPGVFSKGVELGVRALYSSEERPIFLSFSDQDDVILDDWGLGRAEGVWDMAQAWDSDEPRIGLLVGMRLHACIWAALKGVPFIALSYDPKVTASARSAGQYVLDAYTVTQDQFLEALLCVRADYSRYQQSLLAMVQDAQVDMRDLERLLV
ncbi:MAG: hypothetical protein CL521_02535 [Actinobacteria bacterium]|nr:hypothetical protein [Actinomycetota bacterium]